MSDEIDHQSVRRLSQDDKATADHAQVKQQQMESSSGSPPQTTTPTSSSLPAKEWVKFDDEGNASPDSTTHNKSSKVRKNG